MDHQQNAVWSSALWTQHRSRARFPWLHSRTGDKAIRNWRLASVCSIATILDKSPKDSNVVFLIFCNFWLPSKHCNLLKNIFQFSLPTPYTKLKLKKILDTHVQPCLCVCGGKVGHVWFKESHSNANGVSETCPWLKVRTLQFENSLLAWDPAVSQEVRYPLPSLQR